MTNSSSESHHTAPEPARLDDQRGGSAMSVAQGYEPDDGPISPAQMLALQAAADEDLPKGAVVRRSSLFSGRDIKCRFVSMI